MCDVTIYNEWKWNVPLFCATLYIVNTSVDCAEAVDNFTDELFLVTIDRVAVYTLLIIVMVWRRKKFFEARIHEVQVHFFVLWRKSQFRQNSTPFECINLTFSPL